MRTLGNINLSGNAILAFDISPDSTWPTTPKVGRIVNYQNTLYMCISLTGGTSGNSPVWVKFGPCVVTYTHTQTTPVLTWNINHGLNTTVPVVQVYDSLGIQQVPTTVDVVNANLVTVTLKKTSAGHAVVIAPNQQA